MGLLNFSDNNKIIAGVLTLLYIGLALNLITFQTTAAMLAFIAIQGLLATLLVQPIFYIFLGISGYKDVKVKKSWCDLKQQMEDLLDEGLELPMPSLTYKKDMSPNAFAIRGFMSNGLICVNSGLIEKISLLGQFSDGLKKEVAQKLNIDDPSSDQIRAHMLKAVLLHECGHLYHYHGIKRTFYHIFLRLVLRSAQYIPLPAVKGVSTLLRWLCLSIPLGHFSRSCERQSDEFAVRFGYGKGLEESLKRVFSVDKDILDFHSHDFAEPLVERLRALSATHPCQQERLDSIRKKGTLRVR